MIEPTTPGSVRMPGTGDRKGKTMKTVRMTMGQALVRFLSQQYVARDGQEQRFFAGVFGIFGHGNVSGLGQALEEVGADLPYYQGRNEQGMVHIAAAYAKTKNRMQTFACASSIGPGATNMVTGAAVATVNRLPVLLLPSDIFANRMPNPVLQQLEYPGSQDVSVNDAFRPISKYWDRINRPEQILASLPEAMRILTDQAETGTVTICLPEDVQTEAYAALSELAQSCGIPVCETQAGKGVLPWDHAWNVGPVGSNGGLAANRLAAQADLVIAVGTRLSDFTTASKTAFQDPDVTFIGINTAALDAFKLNALPLVGGARATLEALTRTLREAGYSTGREYAERVCALKQEWNAAVDAQRRVEDNAHLTQANVIGIVNEASRPQDMVVCAAGGLPGDLLKLWRPTHEKGYHLEYGYSCMGYEIAGGLGAKMADPSREVYVMVGDGSYLMMNSDIVTSLQEGYKLTIVLVDNSGFQCIRSLQMSTGSPAFGNELRYRNKGSNRLDGPYMSIDFAANAESLGAVSFRATTADELRTALEAASEQSKTVLIHVPVDVDARVPGYESWWDVPVAEVSGEAGVQQARAQYEEAHKRQRVFV